MDIDYTSSNPYSQNPYGSGANYLSTLIGAFHPATRGATRSSNSLRRLQARTAVRSAIRNRDAYEEKSLRDRQLLAQDLAARGLGKSSIAEEDQAMFERARERAMADLNENIHIAKKQNTAVNYAIRAQRVNTYLGYFNSLVGLGNSLAGFF